MTTHLDMLKRLGACSDAIEYCATHPDLRQAWKACGRGDWLLWLLVRLDRRRGIGVLVEVVRATCAHLAADEVTTEVLNPLAAWAAGDDSIDVVAVRARALDLHQAAARAAWLAATAADDAAARAAWLAATAVAAAAAADAARSAAADAARSAVAVAADADDAARSAQADMIRDIVPWSEVAALLDRS